MISHFENPVKNGLGLLLVFLIVASSLMVLPLRQQAIAADLGSEPLIASMSSITKSFTFPTLQFRGETIASVTQTITWNTDGTTQISDSRGYQYSISIPLPQDSTVFTLLQNTTTIDQKVVSADMQYDIYWKPVKDSNGYINKYKFTISGTSNGSTISLKLDGGKYTETNGNRFLVTQTVDNINNDPRLSPSTDTDKSLNWTAPANQDNSNGDMSTIEGANKEVVLDGLSLDWSDAIASGYQMRFDPNSSILSVPVGKSFSIDPFVVTTVSNTVSPQTDASFEGEVRLVTTSNSSIIRINAFYYDGSNIVYRTSDDRGQTWSSSATSTGSGTIASDTYRWSMVHTLYSGTRYVSLLYWSPAGSNMNFYTIRGTVNGVSISWSSPILLGFTAANSGSCSSGGACAAVTAATDSNGVIYAAFRYLSGGSTTYSYQIMKSSDGGLNWSVSLAQVNGVSTSRIPMVLTALNSTKMVFMFAKQSSASLFYRIFDGSSWGSEQTISTNTSLDTGTLKQLSATTDNSHYGYVAYTNVTTTGLPGILKVAKFSPSGSFVSIETADSTLRHSLPNIMTGTSGDLNIKTLANGKVYDTRKSSGVWEVPFNPFGTTFTSPNELTAKNILIGEQAALWKEGTSSPYNLMFAFLDAGIVSTSITNQVSPTTSQVYEGERRVIRSFNNTAFAFYYDGSNIVYKVSIDGGNTWTGTAVSTGSGTIGDDIYRWTVTTAIKNSTHHYITIFYAKPSGSNTDFKAKTLRITGTTLQIATVQTLFSVANEPSCGTSSVCAGASATTGVNETEWVVYKWKSGGIWQYRVFKSTDFGSTWTSSLGPIDMSSSTTQTFPITITRLTSTKMLLVFETYESSTIRYKVFDGSTWGSTQTVSGAGLSQNTIKQMSSDTDKSSFKAYVAYVTGGTSGNLKVVRFASNGTFEAVETADTTKSHSLPSITITYDDVIHIYTISSAKVYETFKNSTGWQAPTNPFGTIFSSPDQLTSQIAGFTSTAALWREGTTSPFSLHYHNQQVAKGSISCQFKVSRLDGFHCADNNPFGVGGAFSIATPDPVEINLDGTRGKWLNYKCGNIVQHVCIDTTVYLTYPDTFTDTDGAVYTFGLAEVTVLTDGFRAFYYYQSQTQGGSGPKTFNFGGIPAEAPLFGLDQPMRVVTLLTYYENCECPRTKAFAHNMFLPLGYDKDVPTSVA